MESLTSNAEIVEIARLLHGINQGGDTDHSDLLRKQLQTLTGVETIMVLLVAKLMQGDPFQIASDNLESILRYFAIAREIGAGVLTQEGPEREVRMIFFPPDEPTRH
jgi:hypothetical protein